MFFDHDKILGQFNDAQNRLVLQASDLSLETIAAMIDRKAIDVAPQFQRRERWDRAKQAALIESFLLNVPVPPVYLMEEDFGTYSIIDGKQRLISIHAFMRNKLALDELETFTSALRATLHDLPTPISNALEVRPYVRVVTLLKQSDPELKYEVFTRLNRGGEPLNAQEIRNVVFRGALNDLVYKLSEEPFLRSQLKIHGEHSAAFREMADAEYVVRFLTLHKYLQGFSGSFRRSMDEFMLRHRRASQKELADYETAFTRSLASSQQIWGEYAFRRPYAGGWRDQTLAGMFDAQMLAVDRASPATIANAVKHRKEVLEATREAFDDAEFEQSVRQGTNTPSRLHYRIDRVYEIISDAGVGD